MDISPDSIKAWLSKTGNNREWLASQCSVSKKTVDGWLSTGRTIPGSSRKIIESLMGGLPPIQAKMTLADFEKAQQIAAAEGYSTVTEWIESLIKKAIKLIIFLIGIAHLIRTPTDWSGGALAESGMTGLTWFGQGAAYLLSAAWKIGGELLALI